ncbi:MAG: phosphate ABC transporter substrate-binding/OmpA family protein [Paracoccaceae bacterium]
MASRAWRAAVFAALVVPAASLAQDVTLTSRDGSLSLAGTLNGFDGEYYRIDTSYGLLTVDGQGVLCDGPGCPDLIAPRATIRLVGDADAGAALLPGLFHAFAKARGLDFTTAPGPGFAATITDPATKAVLADISFHPESPQDAHRDMVAGRAELMVASATEQDLGARPLATDALVAIVAPGNPLPRISSTDLARALAGEVANWAEVGGPDMPLVLHALASGADLQTALTRRLGKTVATSVAHPDLASLAAAVARDPWALAVTGRAEAGAARILPLTDSCGFPLLPTALAVKAEDYPLSLPLHLLTPRRRLPLVAREFLEFLSTPPAQQAIASAGYIDRSPERQPMTADGLRLINAIQGAGEETTLADLKRLVDVMDGADRLSLTFRFQDGAATLDTTSQQNLTDLAELLEAGAFSHETLILAGFSDGSGAAATNLDLSRDRAQAVRDALQKAAPDLPEDRLPRVAAFGEALPMACDETGPGRRLNRRVELWLKPAFVTDTPRP